MTGDAVLAEITNTLFPWLVAWTLVAARAFGLSLFFAPFAFLNLPLSTRFAFAAAIGLPLLAGASAADIAMIRETPGAVLGLLVVKEAVVGIGLGILAGLPFSAAQNAGEIVDTYRGSSAGALFDPTLTTETSELGVAFLLGAIAILVWSGGLFWIVTAIYASFQIWSPLELLPTLELASVANLANIGSAITATLLLALAISGTLLVALFTIDLAFGLASRSTRQFQVFELSLNIKNVAFVLLMPALILPLLQLIGVGLEDALKDLPSLLRILK